MIFSILLQAPLAADTVGSQINTLPVVSNASAFSMWEIIQKGGLIMIPIGFLFVLAIYIFIERFISIQRASANEGNFIKETKQLIEANEIEDALSLCARKDLPIARMVEKGIGRIGSPIKEIEESIEIVGKFEVYELEKGVPVLAVIAGIAPMFGFLGTILGVIKIFFDISQTADVSIGVVSAGLYVKMVSSAAGLVVGVLAYIFYNWLNIKVGKIVNRMERNAVDFLDFLKDTKR